MHILCTYYSAFPHIRTYINAHIATSCACKLSVNMVSCGIACWCTGEDCPECDGNPAKLLCSCKGFKGYGVCSHVLAINHILRRHNVKYQVLELTGKNPGKNKGGNLKKRAAALSKQRLLQNEEDSSDAEEADLQEDVRQALLWWSTICDSTTASSPH